MSDWGIQSPTYKNIAASALIKTGVGRIRGIFCASASAGPTIKLWDDTSATGDVIVNTMTPAAATYYNMGDLIFGNGLYITIGGTVDCTVFYW